MPGFNQQGPMNQGPMTGWGRGVCGNGQMNVAGNGFGNGRFAGSGFRRGRYGRGMGWGYSRGTVAAAPMPVTRETLQQRAKILESELNAVKDELANLSDS